MSIKEFFDKELNITESYQLPDALMKKLLDKEESEVLFDNFLNSELDSSIETFNDYFETGHGERKNFMQDFTPSSITKLIKGLAESPESVLDICAGVGALSGEIKTDILYAEELSERALPILLFTLAIRNKNAIVKNGDVLTGKFKAYYKVTSGDRFGVIEQIENIEDSQVDLIVSNPPYSLKWNPNKVIDAERFIGYETAPKSKADYAFIIGHLNRLKENGVMMFVLPHGVLFRSGAEGKIREQLIRENLIDTVIGLPEKMFTNTAIPTVLYIIKKNRKNDDILFIDTSNECELNSNKQNVFNEEHLEKIITTAKHRLEVKRFSHLAGFEEIEENEFNLNIPRYVDTFIPEPVPDLIETLKELFEITDEADEQARKLFKMFFEMTGTDEESKKEIEKAQEMIKERYGEIDGNMRDRESQERQALS